MTGAWTHSEGLHLLDDVIGGRGHGDDTLADGLGAHEGRLHGLGGSTEGNLRYREIRGQRRGFETMDDGSGCASHGGAAGLDRREYAAKRCEHRSKGNDGPSPSARTRRDRSHRASRGSSASPSLAAEREESQKAGAVAQHSAIGAARAVARRTLLEALTGAFAETRRVIMEVVMAAIFLCVCCVSDATNGASGARARFLSG